MAGLNRVAGLVIAGSMLVSSTGAAAAGRVPAQVNPWATLTVLTGGASAAAVCGAAVAATAAQPAAGCVLPVLDAPPPVAAAGPPPPIAPVAPVAGVGFGVSPLLIGLVALAAAAGLFFAVKDDNRHSPNSPG